MAALPFALRRPWLLLRDLTVDRERPDLEALARIADPERFLWAILPHAARSFSLCINLLPARAAKASAVAYLCCRILDTYEDMAPDLPARLAALEAFAARYQGSEIVGDAPALSGAAPVDERDRSHLLLVRRCADVDRVFLSLPPQRRVLIGDLVRAMAAGMARDAQRFTDQGGVLRGDAQRHHYGHAVLGEPVRFVARLVLLLRDGREPLGEDETLTCLEAGTFIQLANITRDVEKDLARGVAYHGALADDLGAEVPRATRHGPPKPSSRAPDRDAYCEPADTNPLGGFDAARVERVRAAREHMLRQALELAPQYERLLSLLSGGLFLRASTLLMLLFTDRHYRGTARQCGREAWGPRESVFGLLLRALAGARSSAAARRLAATRVAAMAQAATRLQVLDDDVA